jgi:hypothetical protein
MMMGGEDPQKTMGPTTNKTSNDTEDEESDDDDSTLPKGRYVRLTFDDSQGGNIALALNIYEMRVYDENGVNIAANKPATSSSIFSSKYPTANAFDDDDTTLFHTAHDEIVDFIEVDLGKEKRISKIQIHNMYTNDMSMDVKVKNRLRFGRSRVVIKDASDTPVLTTPELKHADYFYTIDFSEPEPDWVASESAN